MRTLAIISGGMDSITMLYSLVRSGHQVRALSVDYGQRHEKELDFAERHARNLKVPFEIANLGDLARLLPGSSQTDLSQPVPEGHYSDEVMKKTVVPNRNMIMLSVAIGHAITHGMQAVAYGAHSGDHAIYPDCRPEFADAMARVAQLCDWTPIELVRPFIKLTKADIVNLGMGLGVDFTQTWSCYKGGVVHCGRCGTCIERREAFHLGGWTDPTVYDPSAPTVGEMVDRKWRLE